MYTCLVCGYQKLNEAPYDSFNCPTYVICPCCGTEFGYDDSTKSHHTLRQKWIDSGMLWWSKNQSPTKNWNPIIQIQKMINT